ncbi:c-type cytochrome [Legionella pneumophila]|uniref:c-type cytochrome n=1 Tax=Legionella pneumophila TaxID=446 RepID=UPI000D06689A|nr:c-type cytochrome [Legionella pneumophila]
MRPCYFVCILALFMFAMPGYSENHHPQEFLKSIAGTKDEGEKIFNHFCVNCHGTKPMISLGAPEIGNERAWGERLKQGMEVLFKHTDEGFNAMPPRGGCFECTDKQLILAIIAMVPKQAQKGLLNNLLGHKGYKQ